MKYNVPVPTKCRKHKCFIEKKIEGSFIVKYYCGSCLPELLSCYSGMRCPLTNKHIM